MRRETLKLERQVFIATIKMLGLRLNEEVGANKY
jgi:hypothetical protein